MSVLAAVLPFWQLLATTRVTCITTSWHCPRSLQRNEVSISPSDLFREHLHHAVRLLEIAKVLRSLQKTLSQPLWLWDPGPVHPYPCQVTWRMAVFICLPTAVAHCRPPTDQGSALRPIRQKNSTISKMFTSGSGPRNTWSGDTKARWPCKQVQMARDAMKSWGYPWGALQGQAQPRPGALRMAVWNSPEPPACKENTVNAVRSCQL